MIPTARSVERTKALPADEDSALIKEFEDLIRQIGSDVTKTALEPALSKTLKATLDAWRSSVEPTLATLRSLTENMQEIAGALSTRYKEALEEAIRDLSLAVARGTSDLSAVIANSDLGQALSDVAEKAQILKEAASSALTEHHSLVETFYRIQQEYASIAQGISDRIPDVAGRLDEVKAFLDLAAGAVQDVKTAVKEAQVEISASTGELNGCARELNGCTQEIAEHFRLVARSSISTDRNIKEILERTVTAAQTLNSCAKQLERAVNGIGKISDALASLQGSLQESVAEGSSERSTLLEEINTLKAKVASLEPVRDELSAYAEQQRSQFNWLILIAVASIIISIAIFGARGF